MSDFVDRVRLHARGGDGGSGVTSFLRQPYEPKGPPDGGDGGHGGSVILRASSDVSTLVDVHHRPHRRAGRGRHGEGDRRRGADGEDAVVLVPVGTVVLDEDAQVMADLLADGEELTVARGGTGGRGNAALRSRERRAPRFHELGEPGEERTVELELRLLADAALVGFPNAGKSSLIARLSAARPKIAEYPFTTLVPNLGVVKTDTVDFVVADVPGLIEGASAGRGLGHEFLRHVRRAEVLVHVVDCASLEQRDPRDDLALVLQELEAYDPELVERPAIVVLNKVDADREVAELVRPDLVADGWDVVVTSAVTGEGIDVLRYRLATLVDDARRRRAVADEVVARPVLRPAAGRASDAVRVQRTREGWRVTGERVERWVMMTDLSNDDAVRYLQRRFGRAGVDAALARAGAQAGDVVEVAGAVFDYSPEGPPAGFVPEVDPDADAPQGETGEGDADIDGHDGQADGQGERR